MDFKNHKANGYNFIDLLKTQEWETFIDRLKGPIYHELIKYFCIHAFTSPGGYICLKVLGNDICVSKNDIANLLQHDGDGILCFGYACAIERIPFALMIFPRI